MTGGLLLAADIGGTNARFALFSMAEHDGGTALSLVPGSKLKLRTAEYGSFKALLEVVRGELQGYYGCKQNILAQGQTGAALSEISAAVMAVPGPVTSGRCRAANIAWPLDERDIFDVLGVQGQLLNDFAAQAHACLFPEVLGLHCLKDGVSKSDAPLALMGAGTGLGVALLLPEVASCDGQSAGSFNQPCGVSVSSRKPAEQVVLPPEKLSREALSLLQRRVLPSEGGHMVFPFVGEQEAAFEAFARKISGRREIIGDMAVTGYGLSLVHAFHHGAGRGELLAPPQVSELIDKCPDVLSWFARFYGRACRNFVLAALALGGLYLSGGMLSHVPGLLGHQAFLEEFLASETKAYLLAELPISWISNQDVGLWGAALSALPLLL